ncbi:MAG: nucleotide exchange factor GrpE [Nocardioides sp.]
MTQPHATPEDSAGEPSAELPHEAEVEEEPAGAQPAVDEDVDVIAPGEEVDDLTATKAALDERTADLQRLQAEFLNYKRRVDRDRELVRQNATYLALAPITEVLDTVDRAREHGDLDPGFQAVAEQLERVVTGLGMTKFGEVGDPFDPRIHEALSHIGEDPEVQVTTCKVVAKAGYRIGDRVVRAAQVLVVDPPSGPTESFDTGAEPPAQEPPDVATEEPPAEERWND